MEYSPVFRTLGRGAKAATFWSAEKWRTEADRRSDLRVERLPAVKAARRTLQDKRSEDPTGKSSAVRRARRDLRKAQSRCPDSMLWLSCKTAAGMAAAAYVGLPLVPTAVWLWTAVAAVIAAVGAVAWAVKGAPRPQALKPSKQEAALLKRLDPKYWAANREARGLKDTITGRAVLSESGITVPVRLDGAWTLPKFRAAADSVRTLLGAATGLKLQVKAGRSAEWASLVLRTRSATAGADLAWSPENSAFGVDTVSGETVTIPLGERILFAGRSGAGKSVATRPLLRDASEGETDALVIYDFKQVEGRLWDHRARVATTPEDAIDLTDELVAEMTWRLSVLPKGQDKWTPTREHPRITVLVDEGAEIMSSGSVVTFEEGPDGRPRKVTRTSLTGLESIARMGRAACVDLAWCTQKPSIDDGIPKQVAPQISMAVCLAVRTPAEARVVLGEDAQARGWHADALDVPGFAMVRDGKRGPDPVQVRYMDAKQVIALPARPIWRGSQQQTPPVAAPPREATGTDAEVISILREIGPARQKDVVERSGIRQGTVSKVLARLIDAGRVAKLVDGSYEVSA